MSPFPDHFVSSNFSSNFLCAFASQIDDKLVSNVIWKKWIIRIKIPHLLTIVCIYVIAPKLTHPIFTPTEMLRWEVHAVRGDLFFMFYCPLLHQRLQSQITFSVSLADVPSLLGHCHFPATTCQDFLSLSYISNVSFLFSFWAPFLEKNISVLCFFDVQL